MWITEKSGKDNFDFTERGFIRICRMDAFLSGPSSAILCPNCG